MYVCMYVCVLVHFGICVVWLLSQYLSCFLLSFGKLLFAWALYFHSYTYSFTYSLSLSLCVSASDVCLSLSDPTSFIERERERERVRHGIESEKAASHIFFYLDEWGRHPRTTHDPFFLLLFLFFSFSCLPLPVCPRDPTTSIYICISDLSLFLFFCLTLLCLPSFLPSFPLVGWNLASLPNPKQIHRKLRGLYKKAHLSNLRQYKQQQCSTHTTNKHL